MKWQPTSVLTAFISAFLVPFSAVHGLVIPEEGHYLLNAPYAVGDPYVGDNNISRGDYSLLEKAFARRDLKTLWHVFQKACAKQYYPAPKLLGAEDTREKFNASLQAQAANMLRQIPGHAKALADEIDSLSNPPFEDFAAMEAGFAFHALGRLGSPESIQQLSRFIHDDRSFYVERAAPQIDGCGTMTPIFPNSFHAATALHQALGEKSPLFGKVSPNQWVLSEGVSKMQQWWHSWSGSAYRKSIPGAPLPFWRPYAGKSPQLFWYYELNSETILHLTFVVFALVAAIAGWRYRLSLRTSNSGNSNLTQAIPDSCCPQVRH